MAAHPDLPMQVYLACLRWWIVAQHFATHERPPTHHCLRFPPTLWGLAGSCLAQLAARPTASLPVVLPGCDPALGLNLEPCPWLK